MNSILPIFYVLAITIFVCPKSVFLAASREFLKVERVTSSVVEKEALKVRDFVLYESLSELLSREPRAKIMVPQLERAEILDLTKNILASSRARRETMVEYWNVKKPLSVPIETACPAEDIDRAPLFASRFCPETLTNHAHQTPIGQRLDLALGDGTVETTSL